MPRALVTLLACGALLALGGCDSLPLIGGGEDSSVSAPAGAPDPTKVRRAAPATRRTAVMIGAGDIAGCGSSDGDGATAALLAQEPRATVFTLGDNAYPDGQPADYANCYDPSWGAVKRRTRPITGDHDTATVAGGPAANQTYVDYFRSQLRRFGATATDRLKAYYSYDVGAWHVVALNSACYRGHEGCDPAEQERWFRADLAAHPYRCTMVLWHDARWSSGKVHGNAAFTQPLWQIAYDAGVDLVLSANEHTYERFAPQDAGGKRDARYGVRQLVVGTGGYYRYGLGKRKGNSEVFHGDTYGVIRLTLRAEGYGWRFVPVAGSSFTDAGSGRCHDAPSAPRGTPTVRSASAARAQSAADSLTVAQPPRVAPGDVLLATIAHQGGSAADVDPPDGFREIDDADVADGTGARLHSFWKLAGDDEPASYKFKLSGGPQMIAGGLLAFQDADRDHPIDAAAGAVEASGAKRLVAPSITTMRPGAALVVSGAVGTAATFTPPQLMPEQWDVTSSGEYQIATTTAVGGLAAAGPAGSRVLTVSTTARGVATAIAIAGP